MTIKTGRIRRKFDEALQDRIVCDNMLLMSISALNYEIQYNESVSDQKAAKYINYRKQLAKSAIDKGISKDRITEVMKTLSDERYPSYNQIIGLVALIKSYSYKYIADYLPDSDMKYKTDTELQNVNSQPVVKRNQDSIESEQQFNEICKIISGNYDITITADMQTKIRTIKESNDIILKTIKQNTNDIYKAISGKRFDNNYEKLCYILGVINRKIPNTIAQIEKDQKFRNWLFDENAKAVLQHIEKSGESFEIALEQSILNQCDRPDEKRNGSYDYVRKELLEAIERVKQMKVEEEKQEQEIESPQEVESVVIADKDSGNGYKIDKNTNENTDDPKNKPIIERIRLLVNGEYLLIDQKYEIAKKEIREMISYLKCEIENKSNDMQKQKELQQDLDFCDEYECKINNKRDIELYPFLADDYEEEW